MVCGAWSEWRIAKCRNLEALRETDVEGVPKLTKQTHRRLRAMKFNAPMMTKTMPNASTSNPRVDLNILKAFASHHRDAMDQLALLSFIFRLFLFENAKNVRLVPKFGEMGVSAWAVRNGSPATRGEQCWRRQIGVDCVRRMSMKIAAGERWTWKKQTLFLDEISDSRCAAMPTRYSKQYIRIEKLRRRNFFLSCRFSIGAAFMFDWNRFSGVCWMLVVGAGTHTVVYVILQFYFHFIPFVCKPYTWEGESHLYSFSK